MWLRAEFRAAESTTAAIEALAAAGFEKRTQIDVFSAKPVEFEPGVLDRPSRMSFFAVCGAIAACLLVTSFVFWAQRDYPLVTGGMPLNSLWATGVITFELTMAGAILTTMLLFVWEARLFRMRKREPIPPAKQDSIYVEVHCPDAVTGRAHDLLQQHGAVEIETHES